MNKIVENTGEKLMEIEYRGYITRKDFLKCLKIISSRQFRWQKRVFGFLLFSMIFFVLLSSLLNSSEAINSVSLIRPSNYIVFLIPVVFFSFPWWLPYVQLSSYNQKTNIYRNEVYGMVNENEITINNHEIKAVFQWSVYTGYKIDNDLVFLFQGKQAFNVFKQDMFNEKEEWEKFVSIAKNKLLSPVESAK